MPISPKQWEVGGNVEELDKDIILEAMRGKAGSGGDS